jgi:hypothetical protein
MLMLTLQNGSPTIRAIPKSPSFIICPWPTKMLLQA